MSILSKQEVHFFLAVCNAATKRNANLAKGFWSAEFVKTAPMESKVQLLGGVMYLLHCDLQDAFWKEKEYRAVKDLVVSLHENTWDNISFTYGATTEYILNACSDYMADKADGLTTADLLFCKVYAYLTINRKVFVNILSVPHTNTAVYQVLNLLCPHTRPLLQCLYHKVIKVLERF